MPVMATVKDIKEIEEGVHSGEITDISVREVKFDANVVKVSGYSDPDNEQGRN